MQSKNFIQLLLPPLAPVFFPHCTNNRVSYVFKQIQVYIHPLPLSDNTYLRAHTRSDCFLFVYTNIPIPPCESRSFQTACTCVFYSSESLSFSVCVWVSSTTYASSVCSWRRTRPSQEAERRLREFLQTWRTEISHGCLDKCLRKLPVKASKTDTPPNESPV